jgi:hypothetical protein
LNKKILVGCTNWKGINVHLSIKSKGKMKKEEGKVMNDHLFNFFEKKL